MCTNGSTGKLSLLMHWLPLPQYLIQNEQIHVDIVGTLDHFISVCMGIVGNTRCKWKLNTQTRHSVKCLYIIPFHSLKQGEHLGLGVPTSMKQHKDCQKWHK